MTATTTIAVLFFAQAREAAGTHALDLAWESGDVATLRAHLATHHPALTAILATCAIAVNQAVARDTTPIHPGDEIAILPPYGGG